MPDFRTAEYGLFMEEFAVPSLQQTYCMTILGYEGSAQWYKKCT